LYRVGKISSAALAESNELTNFAIIEVVFHANTYNLSA
jgi:hypothetical protein